MIAMWNKTQLSDEKQSTGFFWSTLTDGVSVWFEYKNLKNKNESVSSVRSN